MGFDFRPPARFRLVDALGEGGSGRVWLVEDRLRPGSRVALKELTRGDESSVRRLRQEFATLTGLRHPNLVEVHELGVLPDSGLPYFTLEYIEGRDLTSVVAAGGLETLVELAAESLRAIGFLHDFGLIHRDLKPGNLLVRDRPRLDCRIAVLDFGLAMRGEDRADSTPRNTAGTLPYLAPELFDGGPPGPRSDLYALGVVLFEAVHQRPPFRMRDDLAAFVDAVRTGRRSRPALPTGYPEKLGGWLDDLLAADPSDRPASAAEALARLNVACGTHHPAETRAGRSARLASGSPPGREAEVARLAEFLDPSDEPRLIWLCGGPGSGKRRLLRWLAGDAATRGFEVFRRSTHDLARLDEVEIDAWLADLRRRASAGPVLLLLDGGDADSGRVAGLFERVAREGQAPPLRVVAAVRPAEIRSPELRRLLAQTGKVPTLRRIDLLPMSAEALQEMAVRATGDSAIPRAKVRWLHEVSEGDPLLAETLLVDGAWEQGGRRSPASRVDRTPGRRLESLPPDAGRLIEVLAVARGPVSEALGCAASGLPADEAREALSDLTALGLARQDRAGGSIESGALARQVRDGLPPSRFRALHRAVADHLEQHDGEPEVRDEFRLATLRAAAGDDEAALAHALAAAESAERSRDPALAAERYAFALKRMERRDPRRFSFRLRQADALRTANRPQAAARAYGGAMRWTEDPILRADLLARQAAMLAQAGRFSLARGAAERALENSGCSEAGSAIGARAREVIGIVLARQGDGTAALPYLRQAVAVLEGEGRTMDLARALQSLGVCMTNEGLDGAVEPLERAITLFQELGAKGNGLINRVGLAIVEQRAGRYNPAREMLEEARRLAAEHHNLLMEGVAGCTLAQNAVFEGRYAEAISRARESEQQALYLGDDRLTFVSRGTRALALTRCGRTAEAAELLDETLAGGDEKIDPVQIELVRLSRIEATLAGASTEEDELSSALQKSLAGARRWRDPDTLLWALTLELHRRTREGVSEPPEPVREELDELLARGGSWDQPFYRLRADLIQCSRFLAEGELAQVERSARAAAQNAAALELPGPQALAYGLLVEALERLGRTEESVEAQEHGRRLLAEAVGRIDDPDLQSGFAEGRAFDRLRRPSGLAGSTVNRRLLALYDMIRALNSEDDPDALLSVILDMAIEVVGAERGMIFLRDAGSGDLAVRLARNLERETAEDAESFSRHIVAQAGAGTAVLAIDARTDERFRDVKSVSLYGIHSLMCVPLRSRGTIVGTVYLDNRTAGRLFQKDDLRFLEAFADHAALALENARARARLTRENQRLQAAAEARVRFDNLVGRSPPMQQVFDLIEKFAASDLPVLILGDSGTGKELVARAIHFNGSRRRRPFVTENCAAIPESLLQSELFGHVRGAFTGADRDRAGLFEQADGGTLFLDEVGDMSAGMQAQLLRVLQEGEVRRVGADLTTRVDVRVLAATHRDLHQRVGDGQFREDLLYRLQVLTLSLAPLRERHGDLPLLVDFFLERIAEQRGREKPRIATDVLELLEGYAWPGNVRQLESALQRLALLAGDGPITAQAVEQDPALHRTLGGGDRAASAPLSLTRSERDQIVQALAAADGNRSRAAKMLGISRATIYRKMKEFEL